MNGVAKSGNKSKFRYNTRAFQFDERREQSRSDPVESSFGGKKQLTQEQVRDLRAKRATEAELNQRSEMLKERKKNQVIHNEVMQNLQLLQQDIHLHLQQD